MAEPARDYGWPPPLPSPLPPRSWSPVTRPQTELLAGERSFGSHHPTQHASQLDGNRPNSVAVHGTQTSSIGFCVAHPPSPIPQCRCPEDADQITLDTAGDYVDAQFAKAITEKHPQAQFSIEMLKAIKERHASVADEMEPCKPQLPVNGKPTELDLTAELRDACRSIVPPIVKGLRKLISTFDPEFQDRLKGRVLLAGGGSQIKGLDTAIEREMQEQLGSGRVVRIEEPLYGGATGALKIAHDMPEEYWERLK